MRFLALSLLLTLSSAWGSEIIKSCTTTFEDSTGTLITRTTEIVRTEQGIFANGEAVVIEENSVRPGLRALVEANELDEVPADFNIAEREISLSIFLSKYIHSTPEMTPEMIAQFTPYLDFGFDLDQIRSATTYAVGEATEMGQVVLVEAKDEAGTVLGSFIAGVYACK
jgi:hypothetical protein